MNETQLVEKLGEIFITQDKYLFDKHVPEFEANGKFLADFFSQLAVEPRGSKPPVFYYTYSPYDVISGKAPHRASVFENGQLLLEIDFDAYTQMRTAAMTSVVLQGMGETNLNTKNIVIFGSGAIAQQSIRFLKSCFNELEEVSCITRSGDITAMEVIGSKQGVKVKSAQIDDISNFDIIIFHTSAEKSVLTKEYIPAIKKGAFIASFISSTEHGELADEFFDSAKGNVVCDWKTTLAGAKEMARAIKEGVLQGDEIIYLQELLCGVKNINRDKDYTIYRSTGTPIQNLAVLKLLVNSLGK